MTALYRLDCQLVNGFVIRDRTEPQYLVSEADYVAWVNRQTALDPCHALKMKWVVNKWVNGKYVPVA